MSRFTPPIRRKDTARGHHYLDANRQRASVQRRDDGPWEPAAICTRCGKEIRPL